MTLAGYVYVPQYITDHIHLGVVPASGEPSGFGSHGEPPYRLDQVRKRMPILRYKSDFEQAWDGTPHDHALKDSDGNPLIFRDVRYEVRVTPANFDLLTNLLLRRVYLVDNFHCADNVDHTPFVKVYRLAEMAYDSNLDPTLEHQIVSLLFLDMYTVPGL